MISIVFRSYRPFWLIQLVKSSQQEPEVGLGVGATGDDAANFNVLVCTLLSESVLGILTVSDVSANSDVGVTLGTDFVAATITSRMDTLDIDG